MTTFALVGAVASAAEFAEVRDVLVQRGTLGMEQPDVVVAELPPGQRAIPDEVQRIARSASTRIVLLSREPMIRPVVVVRSNVVAVAPGRRNLCAALEIVLNEPRDLATNARGRLWWSASVTGSPDVPLCSASDDRDGATVVHGASERTAAQLVAATIRDMPTDARREARLRELLGPSAGFVHLAPNADHWLVMWTDRSPLWISSPSRIPARWCLSASLAAARVGFARIPAFAGDCLIAASLASEAVAVVYDGLGDNAYETYATLRRVVQAPEEWGFLVEAR